MAAGCSLDPPQLWDWGQTLPTAVGGGRSLRAPPAASPSGASPPCGSWLCLQHQPRCSPGPRCAAVEHSGRGEGGSGSPPLSPTERPRPPAHPVLVLGSPVALAVRVEVVPAAAGVRGRHRVRPGCLHPQTRGCPVPIPMSCHVASSPPRHCGTCHRGARGPRIRGRESRGDPVGAHRRRRPPGTASARSAGTAPGPALRRGRKAPPLLPPGSLQGDSSAPQIPRTCSPSLTPPNPAYRHRSPPSPSAPPGAPTSPAAPAPARLPPSSPPAPSAPPAAAPAAARLQGGRGADDGGGGQVGCPPTLGLLGNMGGLTWGFPQC